MRSDDQQAHVDQLAREMGCQVRQAPRRPGMMWVEYGYVDGPTIENQQDYLAVLHELGHFALGHTQGRAPHTNEHYYFDNGVLRSEAEAWEWAMNECMEPIEYKSRRFMWDYCLGSYYQNSLELAGQPTRLNNGDRDHIEFVYDEIDPFFRSVVRQMQGDQEGFLVPFPEKSSISALQIMHQMEAYLKSTPSEEIWRSWVQ
jgi:hypothetical protein